MNTFFTDPKTLWFLSGLALIAIEFAIPGLTLIFFGIGALITAGCLYLLPLNFTLQVCLFLFSSLAGLFFFRTKINTKLFCPTTCFHNAPSILQPEVLGAEVDVIEDIAPPHTNICSTPFDNRENNDHPKK